MTTQRSFLFLQGMATQFFNRLGRALANRGHDVHRVNFNGGDALFWLTPGALDYRGDMEGWPAFFEAQLTRWAVTDVVLFGDCRPLHRVAIRIALLRGIRVHVVDEGYIRPNWVTMERNGVNGNSSLPRDPAWFRDAARDLPAWDGGITVHSNFLRRATEDVVYNCASVLMAWRYPHYRTHRPWHAFVEYGGWLRRFARTPWAKRRTAQALNEIAGANLPFFLFPLQLDCDSQIRQHSVFGRIAPTIDHIIKSFARNAPAASLLVIKEHPLDNAISDWRAATAAAAAASGVGSRVLYVERANLEFLLERCRSVVTVNSTVGFLALAFGRPVVTLGDAIYDMPGLTFQGPLEDFWTNGAPPDAATFDAFRRTTAARTQINGGFFSLAGVKLAVEGAVARLESAIPARSAAGAAVAALADCETINDELPAASLVS